MQRTVVHRAAIGGLGIAALLLSGCSSVTVGPAVVSSDANPPAAPTASLISTPAPVVLPTLEQMGAAVPPVDLIGRWRVEGPGVLPETYVTFAAGMGLEQPCGPLPGSWSASDAGRIAMDLENGGPNCLYDGGRDWTSTSIGQRSWGDKVVLTSESDEADVVLTRVAPLSVLPGEASIEEIKERLFPDGPATPRGYLALDKVAGAWVRDVADAEALNGVDGINVNLDPFSRAPQVRAGSVMLFAFGATKGEAGDPLDLNGLCDGAKQVTTLVNKDGSWLPPLPVTKQAIRICQPFPGPKVTGPNPVDSLRRAVGGGVDPKTNELVLLDDKGAVIQRLVPRRDEGILIEGPGVA